jgi:acetolactate synthase-1/2/3 large subunit
VAELPPPRSGGEILVDALRLHGIDTVFCVPGESYLAALDALYGARNQIRLVTCRQEGGAGYMAEAYGKFTGRPGVCFVTRGPGACNASIAVHTAMQDSTPLVLFVGQVERTAAGREALQEVDHRRMFAPLAKLALQIDDPARIPELVHHALRTATSGRQGPVVVALPVDMLTETARVADGKAYAPVRPHPGAAELARLRALLEAAERPVMLLGGSGWHGSAHADIAAFAAANRLPVAVSFRRQDLFDNDHELYIGDLSSSVDPKLVARVKESDLLLVVGARLGQMTTRDYTTVEAPVPRQTLVHVYPEASELGRVFQPDLAIASGMAEFAAAARALAPVDGSRWQAWAEAGRADHLATREPDPVPGAVDMPAIMATLRDAVPADTVITIDAGNFSGWPQRYWRFRAHPSELGPTVGAMGYAVPAGIAAKLAAPERTVVCFVGDGGFLMTGHELATAHQHGAAPIVIVVNNGSYGTIRMNQESDYPDRVIGSELINPDFAALARAYRAHGETVARTEDFAPALSRALAAGTAAVIEIRLDVEVITTRTMLSAFRERAKARAAV